MHPFLASEGRYLYDCAIIYLNDLSFYFFKLKITFKWILVINMSRLFNKIFYYK